MFLGQNYHFKGSFALVFWDGNGPSTGTRLLELVRQLAPGIKVPHVMWDFFIAYIFHKKHAAGCGVVVFGKTKFGINFASFNFIFCDGLIYFDSIYFCGRDFVWFPYLRPNPIRGFRGLFRAILP